MRPPLLPREALNPAYLKIKPQRQEVEIHFKKQDPNADTSFLEAVIDRMVYELYGLTEEEIAVVEGSVG